jgi:hypothetical protein
VTRIEEYREEIQGKKTEIKIPNNSSGLTGGRRI